VEVAEKSFGNSVDIEKPIFEPGGTPFGSIKGLLVTASCFGRF
jgi:hypothetical protein